MSEVVATVVRDVSPGLSGAEAALYGGLGGGLVGGILALLGVIVERALRSWGRLHFYVEVRDLSLMLRGHDSVDWYLADESMATTDVVYEFGIYLFNGKEIPTGLRNVEVTLVSNDGRRFYSRTGPSADILNLAPRQFKHLTLRDSFVDGGEAADAIKTRSWKKIEFVGERPKRPFIGILGSKTYRKTVIDPKNEKRRGDQE